MHVPWGRTCGFYHIDKELEGIEVYDGLRGKEGDDNS